MKHCVKCKFFSEEMIKHPSGQLVTAYICKHDENTDPVTAEPVPCALARREQIFCGHQAKHYKEAPEKPKQEENNNVIQLS